MRCFSTTINFDFDIYCIRSNCQCQSHVITRQMTHVKISQHIHIIYICVVIVTWQFFLILLFCLFFKKLQSLTFRRENYLILNDGRKIDSHGHEYFCSKCRHKTATAIWTSIGHTHLLTLLWQINDKSVRLRGCFNELNTMSCHGKWFFFVAGVRTYMDDPSYYKRPLPWQLTYVMEIHKVIK